MINGKGESVCALCYALGKNVLLKKAEADTTFAGGTQEFECPECKASQPA